MMWPAVMGNWTPDGARGMWRAGLRAAVESAREGDLEQPRIQPGPALPLKVPLHGQVPLPDSLLPCLLMNHYSRIQCCMLENN